MNEFPAARRSTHRCLAQNPLHWREHPTLAPLYNGNISSAVYTQQPMGPWGSATTEGDALASIYHYDQLNRLTGMVTRSGITATANDWNAIPTPTSLKAYASQYSYDANGNILTAQRYDSAGTLYDSLVYFYKKSGAQLAQNRLYHLQDLADPGDTLVNPGAGEEAKDIEYDNSAFVDATPEAVEQDNNYRYDALGNLVKDRREGIDTITWTVAGKVAAVVHASSPDSLKFTYGADGQRTSKTLGDPEQGGYREYYIRDAQGNIMAVYLYKALGASSTLLLQDRPIYGSKRVGSYGEAEEMLSGPLPPNYAHPMLSALLKYELTDHLGNVRATVSGQLIPSANSASMYEPHLLSETDYEPFGSLLPGRNYSSASYRFGFQGQEKVDEVNGSVGTHYTAQFWEYDPRIGVRWNRDPITMPWQSPYSVLNGNPIAFVDPQGDRPFGFLGKFFRGIGNTLRGDSWSSRTSSRQVGKRNNEKPEGTSNWQGLLNVFRDLKLGAPAGRMVSQGWVGSGSGSFRDLSGNPIDRTATLNPYRELKDMYGTSRVTVTGVRVWGDADNWPTYAWMNSINRRGLSEPLFASTSTQLIATWPGSWWLLAGGEDGPKPPPGSFFFQTGFLPGLNALPTLEAGIFPAIFARVQLPVTLIHGLFGAWLGGAFNHKPFWTGDVWKLQFGAYSPSGGTLRYDYQYKARVWEAYDPANVTGGKRPWMSKLLYGY